jgi:hypothetical protein
LAAEGVSMESGRAELLLAKVPEALQAAEQCAPQERRLGWVRLVCSGWKCHHDALVTWLSLRQAATDEGAARRWLAGPQVLLL